jgi:hypothetical protein
MVGLFDIYFFFIRVYEFNFFLFFKLCIHSVKFFITNKF